MKIVEDYMNFDSYKFITDQTVYPIFKNAIDEAFSDESSIKKMNNNKKTSIILFILSAFAFLLGVLLLFVIGFQNGKSTNFIVFLVFLILSVVLMFVGIIIFWKYKKTLNTLISKIRSSIDVEKIYNKSFKKVNNGINYLSTKTNVEKFLDTEQFSKSEILDSSLDGEEIITFNYDVPNDARIVEKSKQKYLLIDNKYPASFINVVYLQIVRNSKGEVVSKRYFNRGVLKIDTRNLGDRAFEFTLFKGGIFSKKPIKLENKEFNKKIRLVSDDELKARQMYTPLSMELSVKRVEDINGSIVNSMYVTSTGDSIYFEYSVPMNFMELDIISSTNKDKILNSMYNDFLYDTYTLYWILSIIYIPIYLDK
ncbi:DUF3137 domain-containing protein [Mycoplasma sp. CSL7503-lung]|uniref:DUF3137 domain-containing protein n=1 Tax=Mycoplasma sp. CSL7503-lung TaxID=536372 RepID=UPI0021D260E2|nr:DUF3137 domain-containing protein [Mycoplasma sp. CSL7503-lung]MCU4706938.1 DUF3137 domain-containing protein [Mycoplasma sp. CSL7503-lung]